MDFFRIDCSVKPFEKRIVNNQEFVPVFDDATKPAIATGLVHIGQCTDQEIALYLEVPGFEVTRLGPDAASAKDANEAVTEARTDAATPKAKAAPVKSAPAKKTQAKPEGFEEPEAGEKA